MTHYRWQGKGKVGEGNRSARSLNQLSMNYSITSDIHVWNTQALMTPSGSWLERGNVRPVNHAEIQRKPPTYLGTFHTHRRLKNNSFLVPYLRFCLGPLDHTSIKSFFFLGGGVLYWVTIFINRIYITQISLTETY